MMMNKCRIFFVVVASLVSISGVYAGEGHGGGTSGGGIIDNFETCLTELFSGGMVTINLASECTRLPELQRKCIDGALSTGAGIDEIRGFCANPVDAP